MQKITVLLDTSPLATGSSIRGIGTYTRLLKEALQQRDDVEVIEIAKKQDIKALQKNAEQIDSKTTIIHYPFFDLFFDTLPLLRKFKTVVTVHDVIPLKFPDYYKPGKKGQVRLLKQTLALKGVDAVITDSIASKADIIQYLKIKQEYVHPVYLAAPPAIQSQSEKIQEKVRRSLSLPEKYLLYIGDINYNKNIPQLIKMLKYIPDDIHLVCVGKNFVEQEIPEWRWIEAQIALSDVSDRVHFIPDLGIDATESISALYSGAVAYVQPSLYEGFGLPVLEAMQAGCPVICSNNSSLVEVAGDHAILTEATAEGFAQGVDTVINWTKTRRQEFMKAAYTWSQEFSWTKVAEETVAVYRKVLHLS
jgi:glycosyltransferase involved in cell wall biosynthesis